MTAAKPNRIIFDDYSIFDKALRDKLIDKYSDAAWALKVTDELIFVLTPSRRQEILENYACWFANWVLDGKKREITHDYDPPWDGSGTVLTRKMGEGALLYWYRTLGEWMEEELTGNQTATFLSGCGLAAENFERRIRDSIERDMWESFRTELPEEDVMAIEEILGNSDAFVWGVEVFADPLVKLFGQMKTDEVWEKFKDQVVFSRKLANEAVRRRWEFREALGEKSKELLETSLPQITEAKIERPYWKKENLGEYLEKILKKAEIEYVVAVAEVGLPGHFSNSVAAEIREIGKSVLESRRE